MTTCLLSGGARGHGHLDQSALLTLLEEMQAFSESGP